MAITINNVSPLPNATAGVYYSVNFTASGGTAPYTFTFGVGQSNNNSYTLTTAGLMFGTPEFAEVDTIIIKVTDSVGSTTTVSYQLTVGQGISRPAVRAVWASDATYGATSPAGIYDPDAYLAGYTANGFPLSEQPPARQFFNWVLNFCTNAIQYFARRGISDWSAATTYAQYDLALAPNGIVYQSTQANNINNPPATSPSYWGGMNGYALTGVLGGYVTQAQLTSELASYVLSTTLSSDLASYATIAYVNANGSSAVYQSEAYTAQSLQNYYTVGEISAILANYLTDASFASQIANYATLTYLNDNFYTYPYINANYYNATQVQQILASYDTVADVNAKLANYAPLAEFTTGGTAPNRWERGPTGILHQWGVATGIPNAPGATITYPTPFAQVDSVVATAYGQNATVTVLSQGLNSFQLINGVGGQCTWHAYGK